MAPVGIADKLIYHVTGPRAEVRSARPYHVHVDRDRRIVAQYSDQCARFKSVAHHRDQDLAQYETPDRGIDHRLAVTQLMGRGRREPLLSPSLTHIPDEWWTFGRPDDARMRPDLLQRSEYTAPSSGCFGILRLKWSDAGPRPGTPAVPRRRTWRAGDPHRRDGGGCQFPDVASLRITFSKVRSETAWRSPSPVPSSVWSDLSPPYSFRHLYYLTSVTPICRMTSATVRPCAVNTSTCRSSATISSARCLFLPVSSPPSAQSHTSGRITFQASALQHYKVSTALGLHLQSWV